MDKETILDYATNSPENTNRNVLRGMLDQFSKDSSGLPEVTSEDNGDLLKVVDGEWDKADPDYKIENVIIVPSQEDDIAWEEVTE